ncbi:hypothetical protein QTP86_006925 [Hemibagrus guttatus]|nr:hypothetical protein QTP86_006925 [Hemibagrus guttatus]
MEKYRDGQRELHCVFGDLEKAYDRVPREELWYCMRKSGVAKKYVRVVQDMYERSRTVVRSAVGQTEEFKVEVGLHQGSALSPFLFAMVMDQLSEEVRQESPWTMMFADDIVICSESREQVEENLERWRFALERRGMKVSRSKTEYMCVNEREGSGTVRLQGEEVKKVQEFKYLGSTVQSNGECGKEVKKRVQAGWNGWRKVSGVLCDQKISARIKGKVYKTVVRPAMLYGLETVSLRKRQESELEVAELKMLRTCADQLAQEFTDIFNLSLAQATVPTCLTTTIIPVPKHSSAKCLKDFRSVALPPIVKKCFEKLVLCHLIACLPPTLDPRQCAYRSNRSTENAISTAIHLALTHLDNNNTYIRMMFIDFSSAFNTVVPSKLIAKLSDLGICTSLCSWIMDFLTNRPQSVRLGNHISSTFILNTGVPQGCVPSPLLYSLFTSDCVPLHNSNIFIKYADDTTVVGRISNNDELAYREEIQRLSAWCSMNNLTLNATKTKELIVDFWKSNSSRHFPIFINGFDPADILFDICLFV